MIGGVPDPSPTVVRSSLRASPGDLILPACINYPWWRRQTATPAKGVKCHQ